MGWILSLFVLSPPSAVSYNLLFLCFSSPLNIFLFTLSNRDVWVVYGVYPGDG